MADYNPDPADHVVVLTVAVGFNSAAEALSCYGSGHIPGDPGEAVSRALLAAVSIAMTDDPMLDGSFAHIITHSPMVVEYPSEHVTQFATPQTGSGS